LVFTKPFDQIGLDDIIALQSGKVHESDVLDYKKGMIDDDYLTLGQIDSFCWVRTTCGSHI
jgi:hypothetical protein